MRNRHTSQSRDGAGERARDKGLRLSQIGALCLASFLALSLSALFRQAGPDVRLAAAAIVLAAAVGCGGFLGLRCALARAVSERESFREQMEESILRRHEAEADLRRMRCPVTTEPPVSRNAVSLPGMAYRCAADGDWMLEYVSPGSLELTGYTPDELMDTDGLSYSDLIHPKDREVTLAQVQKALEAGEPLELVYRIINASEEVRWVWERAAPVTGPAGEMIALEGLVTDVTGWQERLDAVEQRARRFQALAETSVVATAIAVEGKLVYANRCLAGLLGCPVEELLRDRSLPELLMDGASDVVAGQIERHLRGDEAARPYGFRFRRAGGEERDLQLYTALVGDDGAAMVAAVVLDVTEQEADRVRLASAEKEITDLLETVSEMQDAGERLAWLASFPENDPVAIIEVGLNGEITYSNEWADVQFGGNQIADPAHPAVSGAVELVSRLDDGEAGPVKREIEYEGRFYCQTISLNSDGSRVRIYSVDITERCEAESELAERVEELERFRRILVGRELRMVDLKAKINDLSRRLGRKAPFDLSYVRGDLPGELDV